MEGGEEGSTPEDSFELLVSGIQDKGKIVMNLAKQFVRENEASVLLIFSDWLQITENFLNLILLMTSKLTKKILLHLPTRLAQRGGYLTVTDFLIW